jgi:signal transduction histidine kinase
MNLSRSTFFKVLAGLLFVACITVFVVGLVAVNIISGHGGYSSETTQDTFINRMTQDQLYEDLGEVSEYASLVLSGKSWAQDAIDSFADRYSEEKSNFFFTVTDYDTQELLLSNYSANYRYFLRQDAYLSPATLDNYYSYEEYEEYAPSTTIINSEVLESAYYESTDYYDSDTNYVDESNLRHVVITGYVRKGIDYGDTYYNLYQLAGTLYRHRTDALIGMAGGGIASMVLYVFLVYSAGRRKGTKEISLRFIDRIPWDIMTGCAAAIVVGGIYLLTRCFYDIFYRFYSLSNFAPVVTFTVVAASVLLVISVSFAARCKTKDWGHNSVIYHGAEFVGEKLHHPLRMLGELIRSLPLIWKTVILGLIMIPLEILCLYQLYWNSLVFPIVIFNLVVALIIFSAILSMKKLQIACKMVADGNLDYRVDTSHMYLDYRRHGEDLNRIGDGISVAVEERLKSERFKTELITNVSHDLKTPLTSIVNYADLLGKVDLPEEAKSYVEVLQRQSMRLKKLTEDLVEASKASTGNLHVEISTINLGELMTQVVGEYEDRLQKANLDAVIDLPEGHISALADGRYLWRVMDNLLSNVCKYALSGTRVYIDAAKVGGRAIVSVKNVSRDRLNISPDALMERFVRGDASRNTEGSGLGLSIAQSLAELMGGKLSLSVDGDLFKAELQLPLAFAPEEGPEAEKADA